MAVYMSGNTINVRPGGYALDLMSNLCDFFEIGHPAGDDVWLQGEVLDDEFLFNGRLFLHDGQFGTVIDNFPKGPTPTGWTQERRVDAEGYVLKDSRGETVFSYRVDGKVCRIDVNLYDKAGNTVATGGQSGLVLKGIPAMIGRGGISIG